MLRRETMAGLVAVALIFLPLRARADDQGKQLYRKYCAACHGQEGKGDGVVSGLMQPRPTNLTLLAKRAGGKFPFMETMRAIDGRQTVRAHGDSDMPVWGEIFKADAADPAKAEAEAKGDAALITEYLSTIQDWK